MMSAQPVESRRNEGLASRLVRQTHRWLSILFTAAVIANFIAMALGPPPAWIVYSPLPPLALMLLTGLYMFVLPYLPDRRARTGTP